jgi:hypothetical protein
VPTIKFTTNEGLLPGSDQGNDDYDDLDEGEEVVETNKEDIRVISNKVSYTVYYIILKLVIVTK